MRQYFVSNFQKAILTFIIIPGFIAGCSDDSSKVDVRQNIDQLVFGVDLKDVAHSIDSSNTNDNRDALSFDHSIKPDAAPAARVCGELEDTEGAKNGDVNIIICNPDRCKTGTTNDDGSFCISISVSGDYLFHVEETTIGNKHYGDVLFPISLTSNEIAQRAKYEVGKVIQPILGKAINLDPKQGGSLSFDNGASLIIPAGVTSLPPLKENADVAMAQVPIGMVHPKLLASYAGKGTAVAAYLVIPLGVTFSSPISFSFPASNLSEGTSLEVLLANYKTGKLEGDGQATVDNSGKIVPLKDQGLRGLGWLVFFADLI